MRRLTAQDIASALLDGRYSEEWQALVASVSEAQRQLPNAIEADVIQDVGDRPVLDHFIGWLFGEDTPPAVQNASVVEHGSVAISALVSSSSGHDEFLRFTFYDAGGGSGYLTVNGVAQPDGHLVHVSASELSDVGYVGGSASGTDTLYVKAYNGHTASWSASTSFTVTTYIVPTVNVQNAAVAENKAIAISSLITSISNPSNDAISEYAFYDAGGGKGHFTVNGVTEPDGQWIYVAAGNLSNVAYIGGSSPGSDTLYVEVYDATGSTWSSYSALTAATYDIPPTVKVQNVTVAENAAIPVSSLITSISNPSNDTISEYGFYDAGDGNGHFTVNGASEPDSQWIYVAASNLGNVAYVGGSSPGSDTLYVEVYDATGSTWSAHSTLAATTYDIPPTVNVQNVTVAENAAIPVASLITSVSNPSDDSITEYGFYDAGSGSGHFTVDGTSEPDDQWIYVAASDLSNVAYVGGSAPGSDTLYVEIYNATTSTWSSPSPLTATTTAGNALSLQYKGFDYVAFYNGAYENSDLLASLAQTGANSIEATLDYGIDAQTSKVVADPNYTDSLTALGDTIAQAEALGLSVMVRPLIDFLNPTESAPYSVGDWRQDYYPTSVATFFASYQQMIVTEAEVAQANGAQMLSIGAELDQLTGPQYLPYWTSIIDAVREVFSGALTYSASWNTASEVSFWNQLNYEGIDCYVPLSNATSPTLQQLVNGWLNPATPSANPGAYAVIGNQSPIQYFETLAQQSGKPLIFTELGYANDAGAAADPAASGNSPDPALQAELYQAFFQAWAQSGSASLLGTYFWEWDPDGSTSNVGPNIDSFSPQNSPAQAQAIAGFEAAETISTGATIEIGGADSGTVTFEGATGTLKLDDAPAFSGQIFNFTGTGGLSSSDQIDLKDILYGPDTTASYTGNTNSGTLTIGDAQHHTAQIALVGNYENSTFTLFNDGSGGTSVVDPPVTQALVRGNLSFQDPYSAGAPEVTITPHNAGVGYVGTFTANARDAVNGQVSVGWHFDLGTHAVTQTITQSYDVTVDEAEQDGMSTAAAKSLTVSVGGPGNDTFDFKPGFGLDVITNMTGADTIELKGFSSVPDIEQLQALLNEAQAGQRQSVFHATHGGQDTVIDLGLHDRITLANFHLADLHASTFIIH